MSVQHDVDLRDPCRHVVGCYHLGAASLIIRPVTSSSVLTAPVAPRDSGLSDGALRNWVVRVVAALLHALVLVSDRLSSLKPGVDRTRRRTLLGTGGSLRSNADVP